jgi:hypothetical protein
MEPDPPNTEGIREEGKPNKKVRYKKIQPRKKAIRQIRPIIVPVPAEDEEIRDVGATARRKRGRPRKPKRANSPDPHKGSVPPRTMGRECVWILGKGTPLWG